MKPILKGEEAKNICGQILEHWYEDETYNLFVGEKGWFIDKTITGKEVIVAFDNTSADLWIEEFDNVTAAERWLQNV